jgi:DNA-binding PadR family transcriptional regulator
MRMNANDLAVLGLLAGEPLHTYEMARRMQEWQIERFTGSRRAALYHAVARLERAGLVAELEREREGTRPERTVYAITPAGRERLLVLLREMVALPEPAFPRFAAGLTFLSRLEPADAADRLAERAGALGEEVGTLRAAQATLPPDLPRIYAIELEYALAVREAELRWIEGVVGDLRAGRLNWTPGALRRGMT